MRVGNQPPGHFSIATANFEDARVREVAVKEAQDARLGCGATMGEGERVVGVEAAVEGGELLGDCYFHDRRLYLKPQTPALALRASEVQVLHGLHRFL